MLVLNTTDSIEAVLDINTTTTVKYMTSYIDTSNDAPGNRAGNVDGVAGSTIVGSPTSGSRLIEFINIYNSHSVSVVATVRLDVSGTNYELFRGTLLPGQTLFYNSELGWSISQGSTDVITEVVNGRLTLASGIPITTSDQLAKTNIYFTPYDGNLISLYSGGSWRLYSFAEITMPVGTLTTDKNYDIFAYVSSGAVACEFSAAWNTDVLRFASGPYSTLLPTQDGVFVKSTDGTAIDNTRRYIGTFRTATSTTTEDSEKLRLIFNEYNRVSRSFKAQDGGGAYNWNTTTMREVRAGTTLGTSRIGIVIGTPTSVVAYACHLIYGTVSAAYVHVGIGLDGATSVNEAVGGRAYTAGTGADVATPSCMLHRVLGIGYRTLHWLEKTDGAVTTFGETVTNGLHGSFMG